MHPMLQLAYQAHAQDTPAIGHVRFTPNSKFLLTATLDSTLALWDYSTGKRLKKYKGVHRVPSPWADQPVCALMQTQSIQPGSQGMTTRSTASS